MEFTGKMFDFLIIEMHFRLMYFPILYADTMIIYNIQYCTIIIELLDAVDQNN